MVGSAPCLPTQTDIANLHTIFGLLSSQCHRGVLSRTLNTNWEEKLSQYRVRRRRQKNLGGLPACQTILNAIGNLFADRCQVEQFLFAQDIFGCFGKLPIHHPSCRRKSSHSMLVIVRDLSLWTR